MSTGPTERTNPQKLAFAPAQSEIAVEFKKGDIIGGAYEIIDLLGQGGMGNIYRARHNIMIEEYALKTLRAENLTDVSWKRFQKEAQAIGRMNHPNIVAIYNFGLHEGKIPYYVMAQLQGKTFHDLVLANGPMPVAEALPLFLEVCKGLGYAHKKGVIHRDVKPPNIVVLDQAQSGTRIKLVDFGIVKLSDDEGNPSQQLTNIGEVCGSPFYMSPEQCEASPVDARSDIYSAGCTFYEVLTGAPPFRGRNVVDTMLKHQSAIPAKLTVATGGKPFPPALEMIIAKMLAKAPADRYQTMEEVGQDIEKLLFSHTASGTSYSGTQSAAVMSSVKTPALASEAETKMPPILTPPAVSEKEQRSESRASAEDQERTLFVPVENVAKREMPVTQRIKKSPPPPPSQDEDDEPTPYQTSLPPYFLRLMVGLFLAVTILLGAIGYWWIQLKPGKSSSPHASEPTSYQTAPAPEASGIAAKA